MIGRFTSYLRRKSDAVNLIPPLALWSPRAKKLIGALLLCTVFGLTYRSYFRNWVPLGPQRTVTTINPKMGVHTRLTDEPDAAKIKRSLEMVREMGAPWIVEYFPWAYYEPRRGQFEWSHPDLVIDHAGRQGLTVIARLGYVPEWARPEDSHHLYLEEENYEAFGRYAVEFVRRYRDKVGYLIIWNEPNLSLEWGFRPVDPASYVKMLKVVYPMVKAAAPEVQVLAGALAPTLDPPGSEWSMNDLDYLQRMYDAGAAGYFDILAIHAYGLGFNADEPAGESVINFRRSELLREIMVRNGDGGKTAMITEGGWNDHPRWTRAVRPAERILNTVRAYEIARSEWPWLENVCLWVFRFPWDQKSYQDYFTFVGTDFEPKAIYLEMQAYAEGRFEAP
ncbi:MAG: beta-galactosidase [Caldilineaceae bacterium]|nr:beta-galactosidase [Caldilineaceae bacterium]